MSELIIMPVEEVSAGIRVRLGVISYDGFEENLEVARRIADEVSRMEPTEDNMKQAKALIANARKVSDSVNKVRIGIKKRMMAPYDEFEKQVKQITEVIDTAEYIVREKVKALEEAERQEKRTALLEIWKSRAQWYTMPQAVPDAFDLWLEPRHLNKTTTMKTCEAEMTAWLERTSSELNTCRDMGPEYMDAFLQTLNLKDAIDRVNTTNNRRKALKKAEGEEHIDAAAFYIQGAKDIQLTEMLLEKNHIAYHKEEL